VDRRGRSSISERKDGWRSPGNPIARTVSDYALALLASFIVSGVIRHVIKIFLGRPPRVRARPLRLLVARKCDSFHGPS
jgi:hypothetical protein